MAGINAIGDLGHSIESLLEAVAAGRTEIERRDVQLLERGFDRLHQLLTRTGTHRVVEPALDLVEAFEVRTTTDIAAAATAARAASEAETVPAQAAATLTPIVDAPLSAPLPAEGTVDEDPWHVRSRNRCACAPTCSTARSTMPVKWRSTARARNSSSAPSAARWANWSAPMRDCATSCAAST